jgi:hypothetical protein
MAGAGVRVFQPGEVLTAALVNSYLQDQVVARFDNAADRDGSFGGVGQPTLEEGRVCYLDSTNEIQYFSGTVWIPISAEAVTGRILTKGDVVVGTAPNTVDRVAVGDNGYVLTADSSTVTGVAWKDVAVADGSIVAVKIADGAVTSAKIADGAIVNADINAAAAVSYSKLNITNSVSTTDLAAGAARAGFRSTQNAQVGTTYTLTLSDLGALVELNNQNPITLTVPTEASVAFTIGDRVDILQTGAGQVTIAPVSGTVTINAFDNGLKLNGQYAAATLIKRGSNTWVAIGNLTT